MKSEAGGRRLNTSDGMCDGGTDTLLHGTNVLNVQHANELGERRTA